MNGDTLRTISRGVGQSLMTVGVVLLLFVVYTLYVTNLFAAQDQDQLADELTSRWSAPVTAPATARSQPPTDPLPGPPAPAVAAPVAPELGDAYARMYFPSLGRGVQDPMVTLEGVSTADLQKGPGHLPGTAAPGEVGNTVYSGHRTTYGAPFGDLGEMSVGQVVVVETRTEFYSYTVTETQIVAPTAIEVTFPVPGVRDATPTKKLLTLTTCNPKYSAKERLVIRGELTETLTKADGSLPAALAQA